MYYLKHQRTNNLNQSPGTLLFLSHQQWIEESSGRIGIWHLPVYTLKVNCCKSALGIIGIIVAAIVFLGMMKDLRRGDHDDWAGWDD